MNEVHNIVQKTGIKTIPTKKNCKKSKWLSEEDLQIAVKRREEKSKGEKERYSHLLKNFPQFVVIHTVKGFGVVNKTEEDVCLELSCFLKKKSKKAKWLSEEAL